MLKKREDIEKRTEEFILPIVENNGFELVDVEFVREGGDNYLRAYIDKPGGITVDDCEAVSRKMDDILDREDYIEGSYIFEVSSPGLDRPLKKEKDFERSIGKDVEIKLYKPLDGKKEFEGTLTAYDDKTVTVVSEEKESIFARTEIALIRPAVHF